MTSVSTPGSRYKNIRSRRDSLLPNLKPGAGRLAPGLGDDEIPSLKAETRKKSEHREGIAKVAPPWYSHALFPLTPALSLRESICLASWAEPFQGSGSTVLQPRVARSSQPWAGGRNPFGIGKALNTCK